MEFMFTCLCFVLAVPIFYSGILCNGSDTLLPGQSLFSNNTLISKGGKFELGLFSPPNSSNTYFGIWYKNIPVQTVVSVFVRDFHHHSQLLLLSDSLVLDLIDNSTEMSSGFGLVILYTGSSSISEAVILDTGNFVVRNALGDVLWQSFDYFVTDTWLPGMKLYNNSYGGLYSWMNPSDPSPGNYSLSVHNRELAILFNSSEILWKSGPLQGGNFASLPDYSTLTNSYKFTYFSNSTDFRDNYFMYNVHNELLVSRIVIDYLGRLMHLRWSEGMQSWIAISSSTNPPCRPNTICNANYLPACRCLDGFTPRFKQELDLSDCSNGCERLRPQECVAGKARFMKVATTRVPANPQSVKLTNDLCKLACSGNCSCSAYNYAYANGDCLLFMGDLLGLESPSNNSVGVDLYYKTAESTDTASTTGKVLLVVILSITAAIVISCLCFFYIWPKLKKQESGLIHQDLLQLDFNSVVKRDSEEYELPIFSFNSIAASTNNFSTANKLGQGGFGPVYKGELLSGQFVAVKRLSRRSGQGLEEFKNETELIAKLQHRNLIRILGCCNENDEMILVYEYLPNQSLDIFLFEKTKKEVLDWKRRVHIISGIAQGLLYLHNYSRLRIVHRDLKASNILLDAEMNPKISDFGMARIFGGNDLQANTKRIVGTYGYMSPEYAMEGIFSVKSDVFAFGVLMLEIISGKKNTGFYGSDSLGLLRYVWNLWKNGSASEIIDPILEICEASSSILALRYIQISLLCVEAAPADRPLISDVVGMLNNERKALASPKNPGFTVGRSLAKATPTQQKVDICSVNELTLSNMEAR